MATAEHQNIPRNAKKKALRVVNRILQEIRQSLIRSEGAGVLYSARMPVTEEWASIVYSVDQGGGKMSMATKRMSILAWLEPDVPSAAKIMWQLRKDAKPQVGA